MTAVSVTVQIVQPRKLAAVRCEVAPGGVGAAWGPAYHHPARPGAPLQCDFGVEVTRSFERAGEVYATETPAGRSGRRCSSCPYNRMNEAYDAIERWMAANGRKSAGHSWEIYGDPTPDPSKTETTIVHLLK